MKVTKHMYGYAMVVNDNITIFFDSYMRDDCGVMLERAGGIVAYLYFEQATEFYKAWRAM